MVVLRLGSRLKPVPEINKTRLCAIGAFSDHVKVNFFKGASLPDPTGLFNAGLEAKASRAIDFPGGDLSGLDTDAFQALIREAAGS